MISYSSEGVKFPNIKKRETSNWIKEVAATYGKKIGEIGYMTTTRTSSPSTILKARY